MGPNGAAGEALVGAAEVAALLELSRQRVAQLATTDSTFPQPLAVLSQGRVWRESDVLAWRAEHQKAKRAGVADMHVCSFCGKRQDQVQTLVLGRKDGSIAICGECADLSATIVVQETGGMLPMVWTYIVDSGLAQEWLATDA